MTHPAPMKRGDRVQAWWDTGALGATIMYGRVVKAGPATYTVEWESGARNRVAQGYHGVTLAPDDTDAGGSR